MYHTFMPNKAIFGRSRVGFTRCLKNSARVPVARIRQGDHDMLIEFGGAHFDKLSPTKRRDGDGLCSERRQRRS